MECIIFVGLQASGKSTFFKNNFFNTHSHISLDVLKTRNREDLFLNACFSSCHKFVVDNTNPTQEERAKYIKLAKSKKYKVICYYFIPDFESSMLYNAQRNGKKRVPDVAIKSVAKRLQPPSMTEGFDEIIFVKNLEVVDEN